MAIEPLFESPACLSIIMLCVCFSINICFVDRRFVQATPTHWTRSYTTPTVTSLPCAVLHLVGEYFLVVGLDERLHVAGCPVGHLELFRVKDGEHWGRLGKVFSDQGDELSSDIRPDIAAPGGVKPDCISVPFLLLWDKCFICWFVS